jgi:serine/threonine protein kinase/tetratricopeptide (TPR) repeat protein
MTPPNESLPFTTSQPSSFDPEGEGQPSRIGPYRILSLLGRGGMGSVYLAEQTEPVRREVAVKLLTTGVDSEIFAARFDAERQTLALMQHPNITSVFDAGVSAAGLPYFVMERVSGTTLLDFCDARRLGVKARIDLFRQICHAVQHAHEKGIVHRDLKPSNVIVAEADGKPVCKVIDFGIAKTIGIADAATKLTMTGISLGTPAYMSPEQARGDADVDTRADVYSLGVTLYELLAGVLPFESKSSFAMIMASQHGDASAPSQRFASLPPEEQSSIAERRGTDAVTLRRELREDLDWVVLKSIERERELRYHSVNEVETDLARHFANQPVSVGPPSGAYRARKFVRRHRLAVAFGVTTALLLVGFSISVAVQARRIAAANKAVVRRQGQAEELIGFMLGDLRTRLDAVGRLELLDEVSKKAMDYFAAVPETELSNEELFRRSQALSQLGEVRYKQGKIDTAFTAFKESLALGESLARRDSTNGAWQLGLGASHYWVGFIHYVRTELDSAMTHFKEYSRITERLVARSPDSLNYRYELAQATSNIGSTREAMGDLRGALEAFQRTVAVEAELVRRDSTKLEWRRSLGNGYNTVGLTQRKLGDLAGAEKSHAAELAVKQAIAARDTANKTYREMVALAQSYIGDLFSVRGHPDDAVGPLTASRDTYAALAAFDTANPERRRLLAIADRALGVVTLERGDAAGALARASTSLAAMEKLVQSAPTNRTYQFVLARCLTLMGSAELALGKSSAADQSLRRAIGIIDPALIKRPTDLNLRVASTDARIELGDALERSGRSTEARASWTQALAAIDSVARARRLTDHLALQTAALMRLDRLDEARPIVLDLVQHGYRRPRWITLATAKHLIPGS